MMVSCALPVACTRMVMMLEDMQIDALSSEEKKDVLHIREHSHSIQS